MIATLLVRSILFSLSLVRSNLLYTDASGGGGNPPSDDEDHGGHDEPPWRNNPQQVRISGAHGPRLNDYDAATKAVLHLAIEQLHVRLADENAWPDTMEKGTWARLCWDEAESTLGADMNPNIDVLKIISDRDSTFRGDIKSRAKMLIEPGYGFQTGATKSMIRKNRRLVEELKTDLKFTCRDPKSGKHIYSNHLIQQLASSVFYKNARDIGPKYPLRFSPFPVRGLALILTAMECSIDGWTTGIYVDVPFSAELYKDIYLDHIAKIEEFAIQSSQHTIVPNILMSIDNNGR
ncbi:hypothetical protein BT96DRAFT_831812 [Gymnopus androsaceus JB14]|uniref:DUF6532 domain-containing protein n=1 Tax=Gymnopus androsaceus JB14 TaxID=1447944 RepID=A0A6A4H1L3_9AGAR|nr:hypothetical protein BT96DRAFT_831812 [Gymnopus androsaceus JB14]